MTGANVSQWAKETLPNVTKCPPIDLDNRESGRGWCRTKVWTLNARWSRRCEDKQAQELSRGWKKKKERKLEERFTMEMLEYCFIQINVCCVRSIIYRGELETLLITFCLCFLSCFIEWILMFWSEIVKSTFKFEVGFFFFFSVKSNTFLALVLCL